MKTKHIVAVLLIAIYALIGIFFAGCASPANRIATPVAPPPSVSTAALSQSISSAKSLTEKAVTRTQTAIAVVEQIVPKVDPAEAQALESVKTELQTTASELIAAQAALAQAETGRVETQKEADVLKAWGVQMQAESAANADGWRKEALVSEERKRHVLKLQSWIGIALGLAAGIAGLKFFGPYGTLAGPIVWLLTYFLA